MPGTSERIQEIFGSGLLKEMPAPMFPKHNQPAK